MGKPKIVVEPPIGPLVQVHATPYPGPPGSEHCYRRAVGHAYEDDYGAAHSSKLLVIQYACYNSGLDEGLNESIPGFTNKPPVVSPMSGEALRLSVSPSWLVTCLQRGEPPIV